MKIGPLIQGDKVEIFTLAGERVRNLEPEVDGIARWDGKTPLGSEVVGGMYFYVVVRGGKSAARGKIGLLR